MRKLVFSLLISVLFSPFVTYPANSATKLVPGKSCPFQGENRQVNEKIFTCKKIGKKWVWDKGIPVAKSPKPTSTAATNTAMPSAVNSPNPKLPTNAVTPSPKSKNPSGSTTYIDPGQTTYLEPKPVIVDTVKPTDIESITYESYSTPSPKPLK